MVYNVKEFDEVARVVYNKPALKTVTEFDPADDEEEEEEEEHVRRYDATFAEDEEEVEFSKQVSFGELCSAFRTFAANRGVSVEISSVRSMFAAMAAGKVLLLSCKNREILPAFLDTLCEYFGISGRMTASDEWESQEDLLWKRSGSSDDYVLSEVSNAINSSCKAPEKTASYCLKTSI